LYLYEKNGEVYSYITNNLLPWEESYYKKYFNLDNKLIKSYLDFADKYSLLIDGYDFFKNKSFLGREIASVFAKINGNLLNDLSTFEVSFGNLYFNYEDYINVIFKLGDSLEINYDDSKVILESKKINDKKEIIDKLIHNIYVNRDKLSDMYYVNKIKKLEK